LATGSGHLRLRVCAVYQGHHCGRLALQPGDSRVDVHGRLNYVGKKIAAVGKETAQVGEDARRFAELHSYSGIANHQMHWQTARKLAEKIFELFLDLNREIQEDCHTLKRF
jgi:hypothetical protein